MLRCNEAPNVNFQEKTVSFETEKLLIIIALVTLDSRMSEVKQSKGFRIKGLM